MRACTMRTRRIASHRRANSAAADPTHSPRNPTPHTNIVLNLDGQDSPRYRRDGSFGTGIRAPCSTDHDVGAIRAFQPRRAQAVRAAQAVRRPTSGSATSSATCATATACAAPRDGVDIVVHAAALKQVPACEYNPFEAVKTNVLGAENVVDAAIDSDVPRDDRAQHRQGGQPGQPLRRDQAVRREDLRRRATPTPARHAHALRVRALRQRRRQPRQRDPDLPASRRATGVLTITDERMTRFWITLEAGRRVRAQLRSSDAGRRDLRAEDPEHADRRSGATRSRPACRREVVGIRPGEKLHEVLVTEDEARHSYDLGDSYAIFPELAAWDVAHPRQGESLPDGFRFASDSNDRWLSAEEFRRIAASIPPSSSAPEKAPSRSPAGRPEPV